MNLNEIVELTNLKLADEMLTYAELRPYFNMVVDEINQLMNTCYPQFPALPLLTDVYTAIPDKYIRTVITTGAAWHYYCVDEEGMATAPQYNNDYQSGLFYMLRDELSLVPEEYQADIQQGGVRAASDDAYGDRGLELSGFDITI